MINLFQAAKEQKLDEAIELMMEATIVGARNLIVGKYYIVSNIGDESGSYQLMSPVAYSSESQALRELERIRKNSERASNGQNTGSSLMVHQYSAGDNVQTGVNEERTLSDNVASVVERATAACMEFWYGLTKTFNASPDKFDPTPVKNDDKFMHFKLAPGGDAREDTYKKIIHQTETLCEKLNKALGRTLFVTEIMKKDEEFRIQARYVEGSGSIFYASTKRGDISVIIQMTMPKQAIINNAFLQLLTTPEFPIGDDENIPDAQPVVGSEQQPEMGGLPDGSVGDVPAPSPEEEIPLPRQERPARRGRFESKEDEDLVNTLSENVPANSMGGGGIDMATDAGRGTKRPGQFFGRVMPEEPKKKKRKKKKKISVHKKTKKDRAKKESIEIPLGLSGANPFSLLKK